MSFKFDYKEPSVGYLLSETARRPFAGVCVVSIYGRKAVPYIASEFRRKIWSCRQGSHFAVTQTVVIM